VISKQRFIWRYLRRLLIAGGLILVAWRLQQTLQILMISLFLAGAIAPFVDRMQKYKIKRSVAVGIIYGMILVCLILSVAPLPSLVNELGVFLTKLPELLNQIPIPDAPFLGLNRRQLIEIIQPTVILNQIQAIGRDLASQTVEITLKVINALGIGLLSLLITAYLVINADVMLKRVLSPLSEQIQQQIYALLPPITECLSAYVLGRIGTSALLGFCTYLLMSIIGVPFAGALGLLMAVANLIPFVGPFLGLIPMVIAAWNLGAFKVITVISVTFVLQQIEAWILQPLLVGPYLNLDPFELLLSVIIGTELFGVVGAILAPPVAGIGRIVFNYFWGQQETAPPDREDRSPPEDC